jgi:PilZ domain
MVGVESALVTDMDRRTSDSERPTLPCPATVETTDTRRDVSESVRVPIGERRGFFRVRAELDLSISADTHVFTAALVNLSPGGLLVSTYRALPRGIVVGVEFDLPASRVVAQGIVCWSCEASAGRVPGYGIAFKDLTRFDRTLIESFCARLAPEAYPRFASSRPPRVEGRRLAG